MQKLSLFSLALLCCGQVFAAAADQVVAVEPYVRLAPPNAQATGGFMVLKNTGDKDVKLVKADNPLSRISELHNHVNDGGVMRMRQVPGIEIKAKGEAVLQPGGLHVMLIELKAPMQEGESVPITLTFDDGSSKTVEAKVMRPVAPGMPMHKGH